MSRQYTVTNEQLIDVQMRRLERLVRNLLIDNKNFKISKNDQIGYYFREYPSSFSYVRGPLKDHAEFILNEIEKTREFFIEVLVEN
ncbi:hypothetical protein [Caulobacter phage Cr30]|uniref:hypothetical protein n=1 Tax=Caulobacter phage Cr30 TaxID=1357714 RepID=UPI0004A9B3D9|nr:hypothetical protein OZ74_gp280 [Caulobacter phage Cr30]AGS81063.1 hypothetical protein [Caulobacter phage Cr30]